MARNRKFATARSAQLNADARKSARLRSVDPGVLAELRATLDDDDADSFIESIVADFCDRSPAFIVQMRAAARGGDRQGWVFAAHTLKGRSGTVGALRVRALCQKLEDLAWPPDATRTENALAALEEELRTASADLAGGRYGGRRNGAQESAGSNSAS